MGGWSRSRSRRLGLFGLTLALAGSVGLPAGDASVGYTLQRSTFFSTAVVERWNPCQKVVTYKVNAALAAGTSAGRASAIADVKRAFVLLGAATGITFGYRGTTSYRPTGSNWSKATTAGGEPAEIVIAWVDAKHPSTLMLAGAAGVGGFAVRATKNAAGVVAADIGRGFVVLNAADNRSFKPGFGPGVTRGELLLHELGHAIGLGHTSLTSQIMYRYLRSRTTTAFGRYDLLGLHLLGRSQGCINAPGLWQDLS